MSEVEASSSLLLLSSFLFLFLSLSLSLYPLRCLPPSRERRNVFLRLGVLSRSILRTRVEGAERIPTPAANECPPARFSSLAIPRFQPFLPPPSPSPSPSLLPPLPLPPPPSPRVPLPSTALSRTRTPDRRTRRDPPYPTVPHVPNSSSPSDRSPLRFPRVESDA